MDVIRKNQNVGTKLGLVEALFHSILVIVLVAVCALEIDAQSSSTAADNLKSSSTALIEALDKNDFEKFADLVDPVTIDAVGGRIKMIEVTRQVSEDSPKVFKTMRYVVQEHEAIVDTSKHLLALVPFNVEGVTHKGTSVVSKGCFIALSTDRGKAWRFASCETFATLYPLLKKSISIPKVKMFVDGVEQQ